jgi:hypothetical protein
LSRGETRGGQHYSSRDYRVSEAATTRSSQTFEEESLDAISAFNNQE